MAVIMGWGIVSTRYAHDEYVAEADKGAPMRDFNSPKSDTTVEKLTV